MDAKHKQDFARLAKLIATAQREASRAQKEQAAALEQTALTLAQHAEASEKSLIELQNARAIALMQSKLITDSALAERINSLSLATDLLSQSGETGFSLAVKFFEADLAAIRKFTTKEENTAWQKGEEFELHPEPGNPADPNAVLILKNGKKCGYLAREFAEQIKTFAKEEGWVLSGQAFLKSKKGGKFNEGVLYARLESPLLGWRGFNPGKSMAANLSAMETSVLSIEAVDPNTPAQPRRTSL